MSKTEKPMVAPMNNKEEQRKYSLTHLFDESIHDEDMANLFSSDPEFNLWSKEQDEKDLQQQMEDDYYQSMMDDLLDAREEQLDAHQEKTVELAKQGTAAPRKGLNGSRSM